MKNVLLFSRAMLLVLILFANHPQIVSATTIYEYNGNPYTQFLDQTPPDGSYNNTMSLSGYFTTENPIAPNSPWSTITSDVISYSFSDGRNTLTDENSIDGHFSVFLSTDSLGNIFEWSISVREFPVPYEVGGWIFAMDSQRRVGDTQQDAASTRLLYESHGNVSYITRSDTGWSYNPGVWSFSTDPIPEPGTMLLFGSGLIGLVGFRRKFKKS